MVAAMPPNATSIATGIWIVTGLLGKNIVFEWENGRLGDEVDC